MFFVLAVFARLDSWAAKARRVHLWFYSWYYCVPSSPILPSRVSYTKFFLTWTKNLRKIQFYTPFLSLFEIFIVLIHRFVFCRWKYNSDSLPIGTFMYVPLCVDNVVLANVSQDYNNPLNVWREIHLYWSSKWVEAQGNYTTSIQKVQLWSFHLSTILILYFLKKYPCIIDGKHMADFYLLNYFVGEKNFTIIVTNSRYQGILALFLPK